MDTLITLRDPAPLSQQHRRQGRNPPRSDQLSAPRGRLNIPQPFVCSAAPVQTLGQEDGSSFRFRAPQRPILYLNGNSLAIMPVQIFKNEPKLPGLSRAFTPLALAGEKTLLTATAGSLPH